MRKTVIVPGCGTWFFTLGEQHEIRVSDSRVLKRIFGPQRGCSDRRLDKACNEELNNLHVSLNVMGLCIPQESTRKTNYAIIIIIISN